MAKTPKLNGLLRIYLDKNIIAVKGSVASVRNTP